MRSLLAPLVVGLVLSLAVVLGVQWSAVRINLDGLMREFIADELAQDADELHGALVVQPGGDATLAIAHFDPSFLSPSSGRYFQVMVGNAVALRSASLVDQSLPATPVEAGRRSIRELSGPNGQALLLSATGYELQGRAITIAVAANLAPVQAEFDKLLSRHTQLSLVMFALLVVLQVVIVRRALMPLRRVQADVGRLERGEIAQLSEAVPAEVQPLVREVNGLLALLAQRLKRSRESLGNLAHALKAPLTVLTHMTNDEHIRADPTLHAQMVEQLDCLRGRIDSELRRARVAGGRTSGLAFDLATEIESLVGTMRKLYRNRDLMIECRVPPLARFHGDREDFLEMCGNLLDNACKWAQSRVLVSLENTNGVLLRIEDDGPGCSPADLEKLAQRGMRLDETTEGHGLGLAIARGIASSYDATVAFGRSETLGGFQVSVSFPPD